MANGSMKHTHTRTWSFLAAIALAVSLNSLLTASAQPVVTTLAATNATLNGTVKPNGLATTAYFEYGPDANYGNWGPVTLLPATNSTLNMPGLQRSEEH